MTISNIYLLQGLREEQKKYVMAQMERKGKDTAMAYAFFTFRGTLFLFKRTVKKYIILDHYGRLGYLGNY
jgi:hypothetical protein